MQHRSTHGGDVPWAIYCRVSTDEQAEHGIGLEVQRTQCEAMAQATGAVVGHLLVDEGYSGKDLKRPAVQKLIELIKAGSIAGVQVWKLDRLTRSLRDLIALVELLESKKIGLVSIHERIDTSGPMGRFTLHLMGAIAQLERETIAQRVGAAMAHLRAKGNFVGGRPAIGTKVVGDRGDKRLVADLRTAPIVAAAFQSCVEGQPLAQIAHTLQREGVYKKLPTPTMVARLLRNDHLVIVGVVGRDLWMAAGKALDGRQAKKGRTMTTQTRQSDRIWPLAGLAVCGKCGSAMICTQSKGRSAWHAYYRCAGRNRRTCTAKELPAEAWEKVVIDALIEAKRDGSWLRAWATYTSQMSARRQPDQDQRSQLRDEIGQHEAKLKRLLDLVAEGSIAARAATAQVETHQLAIDKLTLAIAELDARLAASEIAEQQRDLIQQMLDVGIPKLAQSTPAEQAEVFAGIINRVVMTDDPPEIALELLLPKSTKSTNQGANKAPWFVQASRLVDRTKRSANQGPRVAYRLTKRRVGQRWALALV